MNAFHRQELTPALTNAVRNCRLFAEVARRALPETEAPGAELPAAWSRLLTARELEVARCIAAGWDNRLIGDELGFMSTVAGLRRETSLSERLRMVHRATPRSLLEALL